MEYKILLEFARPYYLDIDTEELVEEDHEDTLQGFYVVKYDTEEKFVEEYIKKFDTEEEAKKFIEELKKGEK